MACTVGLAVSPVSGQIFVQQAAQASRIQAVRSSVSTSFVSRNAGKQIGDKASAFTGHVVALKKSPVHNVAALKSRRGLAVVAQAQAEPVGGAGDKIPDEVLEEAGKKSKIGLYFVTWWTLNVVFNIYNKKVLNAFPAPWLTSTLSLAAGVTIMAFLWLTGLVEKPDTNADFWKGLAPVALAHTIGHVAATVSMSKVAVSFTHIIKSSEPAFSVLVQSLMGTSFTLGIWASLIPIIGGCSLAALTELNFNMGGFNGAMISNLAFVFRNIFSKKGMTNVKMSGLNYYACLSIFSLALLTPFAFLQEGPTLWRLGWNQAVNTIGPHFVWWVVAQSVFYHLYNQVSYMSLEQISPLTFSIGNTMKRVSVIASSLIIFKNPVKPINILGATIAILGTFLYSLAQEDAKKKKIEPKVA